MLFQESNFINNVDVLEKLLEPSLEMLRKNIEFEINKTNQDLMLRLSGNSNYQNV